MATSTLSAHPSVKHRYFEGFPVGFYDDFHPNASLNFEMNRFSTGEPDMIEEMRSVSPRIHDLTDYTRELGCKRRLETGLPWVRVRLRLRSSSLLGAS